MQTLLSNVPVISRRQTIGALAAISCLLSAGAAPAAGAAPTIRVGALKYGTVAWEIRTIRHRHMDHRHGIDVQLVELATNEAGKIALLGGRVDMIVTDWIWVSRERASGQMVSFIPFSRAVGTLLCADPAAFRGLSDLRNLTIGVAGGPLDKSWLLLRALTRREAGFDPADTTRTVFGAPPLLEQQLRDRHVDAVLTYWQSAARLEAEGFRPALTVAEMLRRLGISDDVPMLGYAFLESWGKSYPKEVTAFAAASGDAKRLLATSDAEWDHLRPAMGAPNDAVFRALRDGYRAGIPGRWAAEQENAARRLFAYLAEVGGKELVGDARELTPGTFWAKAEIPTP